MKLSASTSFRARSRILRPYGTRIIAGKTEASVTNSLNATWELLIAVPADFCGIQAIFAAGKNAAGNTGAPTISASWAPVPSTVGSEIDASTWTSLLFSGATTATLVASASSIRRAYLVSDFSAGISKARTDGGTMRLIAIRLYAPATADPLCLLGGSGMTYSGWETDASGRIFRLRKASGSDFTSGASFDGNASATSASPIIGLRWFTKSGYVTTVMGLGDSNIEGMESGLKGKGWPFYAMKDLVPADGSAVEYLSMGWGGQTISRIGQNLVDLIAAGLAPDVAFLPAGTINNVTGTIDDTEVATLLGGHRRQIGLCADAGIVPIPATWQPYNHNAFNLGASDSKRRDLNTLVLADTTFKVADVSTAVSGVDDGNGMIELAASMNLDNTHLNAVGNAAAGDAAQATLLQACPWLRAAA